MRPPCTVSFEKSASSALRSAAVNWTSSAPRISRKWSTLRVPGMETMNGFWARSHASAICAGVAFFVPDIGEHV
jgi:hypothetical protein